MEWIKKSSLSGEINIFYGCLSNSSVFRDSLGTQFWPQGFESFYPGEEECKNKSFGGVRTFTFQDLFSCLFIYFFPLLLLTKLFGFNIYILLYESLVSTITIQNKVFKMFKIKCPLFSFSLLSMLFLVFFYSKN